MLSSSGHFPSTLRPLRVGGCHQESKRWPKKGDAGGEKSKRLTVDIEGEVGRVAAHVAGGCTAIGTAVTLVQEGEDECALLGHLQGWLAAFLYPQVLLGAVEMER